MYALHLAVVACVCWQCYVSGAPSTDLVHQDALNLLATEVSHLRSEVLQMNLELANAASNVKTLTQTNAQLTNKIDSLEVKTLYLEKRIETCENSGTNVTKTLNTLTNEIDNNNFKVMILQNDLNFQLRNVTSDLDGLKASIAKVEKDNMNLVAIVDLVSKSVNSSLQGCKAETANLKTRIVTLENSVPSLIQAGIHADTTKLERKITSLESNVHSLMMTAAQTGSANLDVRVSNLEGLTSSLLQSMSMLNRTIETMRTSSGLIGSVRFWATFKDTWTNGQEGAIVKYGTVMMNEGQGYDPNSGVFTCPVSGLYLMSLRAADDWTSNSVIAARFHLIKNHQEIVMTDSEKPAGANYNDLNAVTVPVMLRKGDSVHVTSNFVNDSKWTAKYGFFWGVLVAPTL